MQDNLNQFIAEKNGQTVNFDGIAEDSGQCVQLVALWCQRIGLPVLYHNAADWWTYYGGDFEQHWVRVDNDPNNPNQLPSVGDVVVFNHSLPGSTGYGHIDIFVQDLGIGSWQGYDSNWSGKYAHLVNHTWSYVLGWFTPRHIDPPAASPPIEAPINVEVPLPEPPPVEPPPLPYVPPAAPVPFPYDTTPYTVIKSIFGFDTATDAGNQANAKQSVEAGDYFVYKRYPGNDKLINVTKTLGTAGTWIDSDYNVPDPPPEPPKPVEPEPTPISEWPGVRDQVPPPAPEPIPVIVTTPNFRATYKPLDDLNPTKPHKFAVLKTITITELGTQGKDITLIKGQTIGIYGTFTVNSTIYGRPILRSDTLRTMYYGVPLMVDGHTQFYVEPLEDTIQDMDEDIPTYATTPAERMALHQPRVSDFLVLGVANLERYLENVQQFLSGNNKNKKG